MNLTLNRDKDDFDDSPDDLPEEPDTRKTILQHQAPKAPSKAKQLTTRSRSVLGCDQIGIETLVSMLSSGGSDSEKEETQHAQTPPTPKPETSRTRTNMLRKTGGLIDWLTDTYQALNSFHDFSVSFQDDDSFLQPTLNKDPFARRSNVPFAGRMRNTRTLFGQEISNLYLTSRWVVLKVIWMIFEGSFANIEYSNSTSVTTRTLSRNSEDLWFYCRMCLWRSLSFLLLILFLSTIKLFNRLFNLAAAKKKNLTRVKTRTI